MNDTCSRNVAHATRNPYRGPDRDKTVDSTDHGELMFKKGQTQDAPWRQAYSRCFMSSRTSVPRKTYRPSTMIIDGVTGQHENVAFDWISHSMVKRWNLYGLLASCTGYPFHAVYKCLRVEGESGAAACMRECWIWHLVKLRLIAMESCTCATAGLARAEDHTLAVWSKCKQPHRRRVRGRCCIPLRAAQRSGAAVQRCSARTVHGHNNGDLSTAVLAVQSALQQLLNSASMPARHECCPWAASHHGCACDVSCYEHQRLCRYPDLCERRNLCCFRAGAVTPEQVVVAAPSDAADRGAPLCQGGCGSGLA
jgi:hypothetical protein